VGRSRFWPRQPIEANKRRKAQHQNKKEKTAMEAFMSLVSDMFQFRNFSNSKGLAIFYGIILGVILGLLIGAICAVVIFEVEIPSVAWIAIALTIGVPVAGMYFQFARKEATCKNCGAEFAFTETNWQIHDAYSTLHTSQEGNKERLQIVRIQEGTATYTCEKCGNEIQQKERRKC
jgi:transcription elongation factor Elf1